MHRSHCCVPVLMIALSSSLFGQVEEDAPALPQEEQRTLEWSGNLDVKFTGFHMNQGSAGYALQFPAGRPSSPLLTQYRLEPYLNAEYRTRDAGFFLSTHATYFSEADAQVDLFEAYGSFTPSFSLTVQAGKRVYNWGKGYAFNPSGFVNPVKDPENPELAQAGLLSANVEYVKSFSTGALQNMSLLLVVIPSVGATGSRFGELKRTDLASRASFLLWDTDIDLMGYTSAQKPRRVGVGIARNLSENFEIHGEAAYSTNVEDVRIADTALVSTKTRGVSFLLGMRYLHESNTTLIAEYYHNAFGMKTSDFDAYNRYLGLGAQSGNPAVVQDVARVNQAYFRGSTLKKDYLYVKITRPEPFDWLYFTPSLFLIYGIGDGSFLLSAPMNYKPVTNVEFILWPTLATGKGDSEYGSKAFRQRVELWMRVFF